MSGCESCGATRRSCSRAVRPFVRNNGSQELLVQGSVASRAHVLSTTVSTPVRSQDIQWTPRDLSLGLKLAGEPTLAQCNAKVKSLWNRARTQNFSLVFGLTLILIYT